MKNIDPKKVVVTFGEQNIGGWADGEFISVAFSEAFSKVVGADGEATRVMSNDDSAEVTITLMQSSKSNDYLTQKYLIDRASGVAVLPFTVTNLLGTEIIAAAEAWVAKLPDVKYSKGAETRAWTLHLAKAIVHIGGAV